MWREEICVECCEQKQDVHHEYLVCKGCWDELVEQAKRSIDEAEYHYDIILRIKESLDAEK